MTDFLKLSKDAYSASTSYLDTNWRKDWDYSIRAFRNEHAQGSKYLASDYAQRSRIFRPKTRSVIRKNEAAAAVALFSNMDVINVAPGNPDDVMSVASAAALKEVIQHRLTKTIPWFQVCIGAFQDAQVQGVVCSYQYWEYERGDDVVLKDKPCIDLVPVENIRFDAAASWTDPVNTSPFFAHIIPMYVCDVREMMESVDDKTGRPKWKKLDDKQIQAARPDNLDMTRQARIGNAQDPQTDESAISDFETVWVMRWFMKSKGKDYTYYTLGTEEMLTDPKPIKEVYFHGKRPYVMGNAIIETHKALSTSIPVLTRQIQQEANEIANQRLDNVKFVLNKRWLVARGRQVDVQSLVRNVPGGVTLLTDPNTDIKESNWPDVTSSSFAEQDRLNVDFDELAGNFSGSSVMTNRALNETVGGMKMLNQGSSMMTEYLIATFRETWIEPVLRQLVLLEQKYETDDIVLSTAAKKARLFPRFGISQISDQMLESEVNVTVNVGMGSTNPTEKLQRFMGATSAALNLIKQAPPSFNVMEGIKEIYSNAGYRDGERFFTQDQDPRLMAAMQQLQQLQGVLQSKQAELQAEAQVEQMKVQSNERIKGAEIQVNAARIDGDLKIRASEIAVEQQRLELDKLRLAMDAEGSTQDQQMRFAEMSEKIDKARRELELERQRLANDTARMAFDMDKESKETNAVESNESRVGQVADSVRQAMEALGMEISGMKSGLQEAKQGIADVMGMKSQLGMLQSGMASMAGMIAAPKKKMTKPTLKKTNGKTTSIVFQFDDGSEEEMPVGVANVE